MGRTETRRLLLLTVIALSLLGGAIIMWPSGPRPARPHAEHADIVVQKVPVFQGRVVDFGILVYEGPIDLNPTMERINAKKPLRGRKDGGIFHNRERTLPIRNDPEYYREFIHWDEALNQKLKGSILFPGPQRIVIGKGGEVYYTGDHYKSWVEIKNDGRG